ncbi:uncharacterized protein LOC104901443 [Beta vulgaris subsp. vulgaris]|uniref:uncharacterized protein LOC104901443 n=1 Tax=Beta vulgaris subsp. vulgaris TaxID=3555 RepID=UPI0025493BDC|nr:uncharacterized protein LOC104901443 [Beta vulgaris subsp. vulgaris]
MLLRAGRCLQQYIVDMYVKIENTRLDFFRYNQKTIRADLYQGILDTLESGENSAANVHRVILPPSFLGGPRDMKMRYLNAMCLVQRYGKPDLFITMTCNVNWPEIKNELAVGEEAQSRPNLVARIFRAKLLALKKHILNHMMHGPCGHMNPECACMKHLKSKGSCKYGYPKQFRSETINNGDGYPMYKRWDTGDSASIRKATLDNRWVIPYNPYLSSLFDCHLDVEVCSTIEAVKYLYKYVYKGHDKISFNVVRRGEVDTIDEIEHYQSGRWVSACEASWRTFGFDLFEMHPSVMPLPVHLPNMQTVQIRPYEQLDSVVLNDKRSRTPLTTFFKANATIEGERSYLYGEFTEHYRWDLSSKEWVKRKNKVIVIGRLTFVTPTEGEIYFLRLLLLNVRGLRSFEDLLTVDGYRCASFQEAAIKLRLLEEDDAIDKCLAEACEVQMPPAIRRLFSTVLIFCQPSDPNALWLKYYAALSEILAKIPNFPEKVKKMMIRRTKDIADALDAPIPQDCIDCRSKLNSAQQKAFDAIIHHVKQGKPDAFFIDGPGGTGKMFLYNALYAEVRLMNQIVLPTATSGIAASNIPSGRTAYSRFKIPIDSDASLACDRCS